MNRKTDRQYLSVFAIAKGRLSICLALVGIMLTGGADAQLAVVDPGSIAQDAVNFGTTVIHYGAEVKNFADEAARWTSTVQQYTAVIQHYEQQLISLQNLNVNLLQATNSFTKRDKSVDLKLFCPGASTPIIDIAAMVKQFTANLAGNIASQQQQVCSQISQLRDQKFNDTVEFIQTLTDDNNKEILQIETQRNNVGTAEGALAANQNETARYVARTNTNMQTWQGKMNAYGVQIEFLMAQQSALATRAMEGDRSNPNLWGEATQAVVLGAALTIDN